MRLEYMNQPLLQVPIDFGQAIKQCEIWTDEYRWQMTPQSDVFNAQTGVLFEPKSIGMSQVQKILHAGTSNDRKLDSIESFQQRPRICTRHPSPERTHLSARHSKQLVAECQIKESVSRADGRAVKVYRNGRRTGSARRSARLYV
ncbi:hypothetical protein EVAR_163_1 [Eumeta japonica]|uniref:Uncharacterized protein n=1 Tax=Eumeta variegata TaxID=151549 RepID=A0A4C1S8L6_EUMVA|nr:hypothetical protein EVAR_163_1 [Eumeta japonica]